MGRWGNSPEFKYENEIIKINIDKKGNGMSIAANKVATIHFTITDEKGMVQDTTKDQPPYSFLGSADQMFSAVEKKLSEMEIGSKATLNVEAVDAYGEYDEDYVKVTDRAHFPDGVELKEGMTFLGVRVLMRLAR